MSASSSFWVSTPIPRRIRASARRYPTKYPTRYITPYQRRWNGPKEIMSGGIFGYGIVMPVEFENTEALSGKLGSFLAGTFLKHYLQMKVATTPAGRV